MAILIYVFTDGKHTFTAVEYGRGLVAYGLTTRSPEDAHDEATAISVAVVRAILGIKWTGYDGLPGEEINLGEWYMYAVEIDWQEALKAALVAGSRISYEQGEAAGSDGWRGSYTGKVGEMILMSVEDHPGIIVGEPPCWCSECGAPVGECSHTRECTCGSGKHWASCPEASQECG